MGGPAAPWAAPLVGRGQIIDSCRDGLLGVPPRGVVISGPAGQGKSRLAAELVRLSAEAGMSTASIHATEAAASITLGALAPLLPEPEGRPESPTDQVRRAVAAIARLGDGAPPVLAVDDAHLLDGASAAVIHQLALARSVVPVVTVRVREPAPDAVTALWKDALVDRVDLPPLEEVDLQALAATVVEGTFSQAAIRALWSASLGNPLVANELLRAAVDQGTLAVEKNVWRFTEQLRPSTRLAELVGERLAAESGAERSIIELLAVGGTLPWALVAQVADEDTVSALERRGVVILSRSSGRTEVALAHPIHATVVRDQMGVLATAAANRALADAAIADPGHGVDPVRTAVWLLDGGGPADASLLLRAARLAYFARDDQLAERLAVAAVEAGAVVDGLVLRCQALAARGRHAEVEPLLAEIDLAEASDGQRVAVARCRSFALFWGLGLADEGLDVLRSAESEIADPGWREELRAERSVLRLLEGDVAGAMEMAVPIAADGGDRALVTASIAVEIGLAIGGSPIEGIRAAERAFAVHVGLGPQEALAQPGMHLVGQAVGLVEAGRLREAVELCAAGHAEAVAQAVSSGEAWFLLIGARAALLQGRLEEAARAFNESAGIFADIGEFGPRRWGLAGGVLAAAQTGDPTAALDALDASPPVAMRVMHPDVERARAWCEAMTGHTDAAAARLTAAAEFALARGSRGLALAAYHDLARVGHVEGARAAAGPIGDAAIGTEGELCRLRLAHVQAMAAEDPEALAEVAAGWESIGATLFAAEATAAASTAWRRGGRARAAARAANRAASLAARCEGASTPGLLAPAAAAVLTSRERQVAEMAATGLASRNIAERLGVSPRTVENHLQRAYTKLAVGNRAELAEVMQIVSARDR